MRDDLLDAHESVDWAVSKFPSLDKRLKEWISHNVHVTVKKLETNAASDVLVAIEKSPLPRSFNVETGAYINAIRSSLDLLATSLAYRHCIPKPDDAYFPIAKSRSAFEAGNYKGAKFINSLPQHAREVIESLEPYDGGNETLWLLHHLDIVRKHKRLLAVEFAPAATDFTPIAKGWLRANDETILGLIRKGAAKPKVELHATVTIDDATISGVHVPLLDNLRHFARLAHSIIESFDS